MHLQQVIDRQCDGLYEHHCHAKSERGLYVLRHGKVRTHAEEEGEYHIVCKDTADKQTNSMFHYLPSLSLIER